MIGTTSVLGYAPRFCECGEQKLNTYRGVYDCPVCTTEPRRVFDVPEDVPLRACYPNRAARRKAFR